MELAAAGDDLKTLRRIASNLIAQSLKDDTSAMPAIREIADRTDGKVAQALIGGEPDDPAIRVEQVERTIVRPENTNG